MANYETSMGNGQRKAKVGERVSQVTDSAQEFISNAKSAATDLGDFLDVRERTRQNPYPMLAAAAGVGYILGGGLFTPLTGRIIKLGIRLAALPFVKEELVSIAENAMDGFVAGARERDTGGGTNTPT